MAFLNLSSLESRSFEKAESLSSSLGSSYKRHHIFLSYRRVDRIYVARVVEFLNKISSNIYVDYLDDELPETPSSKTAEVLRRRILQSRKVIQLITPNSNGSKWMPWELGLGDGLLGYPNAITLPAITNISAVFEQEYLGIYGHIETSASMSFGNPLNENWQVVYPIGSVPSPRISLFQWLTQ